MAFLGFVRLVLLASVVQGETEADKALLPDDVADSEGRYEDGVLANATHIETEEEFEKREKVEGKRHASTTGWEIYSWHAEFKIRGDMHYVLVRAWPHEPWTENEIRNHRHLPESWDENLYHGYIENWRKLRKRLRGLAPKQTIVWGDGHGTRFMHPPISILRMVEKECRAMGHTLKVYKDWMPHSKDPPPKRPMRIQIHGEL